jgi:hypothetical protein
MNTAIPLQPFLTLALQAVALLLAAIAVPFANKLFDQVTANTNLKGNATARSIIDGGVDYALAYAEKFASAAITRVGYIDCGNATVAAAANYILSHFPEELAQIGYTEQHVIELVRSALGLSSAPSTPEKTS